MHAIVGFILVPIDADISVSLYIAVIERVLEESGLIFEINCNSTNVEGKWEDVFAVIKRCHEVVHGEGASRIHTAVQEHSAGVLADLVFEGAGFRNPGHLLSRINNIWPDMLYH